MDLIPVLYEAEERYGYMSDEAIAEFQRVLRKVTMSNPKNHEPKSDKISGVEYMPISVQIEVMEMYSLGYSPQETGNYFDISENKIRSYLNKMFRIGRLEHISADKRRKLHVDLINSNDRGKFQDVRLISRINHKRRAIR